MEEFPNIFTVTLNAAIDRVIEVKNFAPGAHCSGVTTQLAPGGKGINVSKVLDLCHVESTALAFVGQQTQHVFTSMFESKLINDATLVLPGRNRENITILDSEQNFETHIRDEGIDIPGFAFRELLEHLRGLIQPGDIVAVSSSLPSGIDSKMFADLIDQLIEAEAKVCVDTSGEGLEAIKRKKLWLIKPNLQEFSELAGKSFESVEQMLKTARGLAQKYENILLSAGPQGAYLINRQKILHASCELPEDVHVNTVGCGDALLAGFIAANSGGALDEQALSYATAIATASAADKHTASFDIDICESLFPKVQVEQIS